MLLGVYFIYGFFFHNSGKLLSFLVLSSYSCRLIIFWLVSHWAASELVGVVIAFYCLYFVPPSLTLNLSYSIRSFAVYCTIRSLWVLLMTSCVYPGKHVNVSFSNKERQNIPSKRIKSELETPTPQVRLQQRNGMINLSLGKQSKLWKSLKGRDLDCWKSSLFGILFCHWKWKVTGLRSQQEATPASVRRKVRKLEAWQWPWTPLCCEKKLFCRRSPGGLRLEVRIQELLLKQIPLGASARALNKRNQSG